MAWRLHPALQQLRDQLKAAYPDRSTKSDGAIGDAAHAASKSDHNPDEFGVVHAIDITHDPAHGFDAAVFAERLRLIRDPRIKYVIFKGRIFSSKAQPWKWRPYSGANAHAHHVHVSVQDDGDWVVR